MTFIPNDIDAFNTVQAEFDPQDFVMINHMIRGNGILSGCACTEDAGGASLDIDIAVGSINLNHDTVEVVAGSVTLTTADGSNPRIDLVVIDSGGTKTFRTGTPAATPVMPTLSADDTCLCAVWVPASDTAITDSQISDKRLNVRGFVAIRKPAVELVNNSTTLQNDDDLKFHMAANEKWAYYLLLFVGNDSSATPNMKTQWTKPSGFAEHTQGSYMPHTVTIISGDMRFLAACDEATLGFGNPALIGGVDNTVDNISQEWGIIENGSTSGDFQLQWAQFAAHASNTNVYEGSLLLAWKQ